MPDDRAPTGVGFSVSLKDTKSGVETASSFAHAVPWMAPAPEGRYVAGSKGFEFRTPAGQQATMHDIGMALAIDVMRSIGPPIGKK